MNKELIKLIKKNPDLPIYAWVDAEIVGDGFGWWLGKFGKAEVREFANVPPFGYYDMCTVFKDDTDEYVEYLLNTDEYLNMLEEDATKKAYNVVENLDYKKAIFVYVEVDNE